MVMQINDLQLYRALWINITSIVFTERSQTQKSTHCMIPFRSSSEIGKAVNALRGQEEGRDWQGLEGGSGMLGISCFAGPMVVAHLLGEMPHEPRFEGTRVD